MKPPISGKELLSIVKKLGFKIIRVRGSHHFVKKRGINNYNSSS